MSTFSRARFVSLSVSECCKEWTTPLRTAADADAQLVRGEQGSSVRCHLAHDDDASHSVKIILQRRSGRYLPALGLANATSRLANSSWASALG